MDKATTDSLDANREDFHQAYDKFLLRAEHLEPLVRTFFKEIRPPFQAVMDDVANTKDGILRSTDLFNLVLDTMTKATAVAFLGPKPLELDPSLARHMSDFIIHGFWPLFAGIPTYLLPHTYRVKKAAVTAMRKGVVDPQLQGTPEAEKISAFTRYQVDYHARNLSPHSNAMNIFSFVFGQVDILPFHLLD